MTEQDASRPLDGPVLVTGGTGFIGRSLVAALRQRKTSVRVLVRQREAAREMEALGAEPVVGDLLEPDTAPRIVAGVRAVYHLAGRLFSPAVATRYYERLHVDGTVALLRATVDRQADRASGPVEYFVLCSTTGVLGPTAAKASEEEDVGRPGNAYELTKAKAERIAVEMARPANLPLAIARPGLVYGPGDRHLVGWFRAIAGGYYHVIGRGTNRLHPIYIDDLTSGLLLMPKAASAACRAYHLVGPRTITMRQLSDEIGVAVGRRVSRMHVPRSLALAAAAALEALPVARERLPLTRSRVRFMTQNRVYDGSRACRELGFVPKIDLAEGLAKTVEWYRAAGLM